MQVRKTKTLHHITVEYRNGVTRTVKVKASSRESAEKRALKFNPTAVAVKKDA